MNEYKHFVKLEDGYTTIICKEDPEAMCHASWNCDCESWDNYHVANGKPVHIIEDWDNDKQIEHIGYFDESSCIHQDWFDTDELLEGSLEFPIRPEWQGDYFTYHILKPVVSEVQLQAIRDALEPITDKIYKLGVTSGRGGALWPDEETYIDDELFLDECVSAVKAVLEGSDA